MGVVESPATSDWIFFISQVVLNLASVWLAIYLFMRQQQDAEKKRMEEIAKDLKEILHVVKVIDRTTLETHNHFVLTQTNILEKMITENLMMVEQKFSISLPESNRSLSNESGKDRKQQQE